jgi:hypothetical protein
MPGYSPLPSEFDGFLFAPVGEEGNDMPLSVLSALVRLGVDPWQEAARLTQLPKELATQSLASMIGNLPSGRWVPTDSRIIAARLVQLLPSRSNSNAPSGAFNRGVRQTIRSLAVMWLIYGALCAGVLLMSANREPPSAMNYPVTPLTSAVSPPRVSLPGTD